MDAYTWNAGKNVFIMTQIKNSFQWIRNLFIILMCFLVLVKLWPQFIIYYLVLVTETLLKQGNKLLQWFKIKIQDFISHIHDYIESILPAVKCEP